MVLTVDKKNNLGDNQKEHSYNLHMCYFFLKCKQTFTYVGKNKFTFSTSTILKRVIISQVLIKIRYSSQSATKLNFLQYGVQEHTGVILHLQGHQL